MNRLSYMTMLAIIQLLIFYDNYCVSIEYFYCNILSFTCGVVLTHLVFEYITYKKTEELMRKLKVEDVL